MAETNLEKQLVDVYNDVDSVLRDTTDYEGHLDHSSLLKHAALNNPVVARHLSEMRSLAQLRNTIVHNPFGADIKPLVTPNEIVVDRYKAILKALRNPPLAMTIAVPGRMIYTAKKTDNLMEVFEKMDKNIFTHVPIIEGKQMVGVLSENSLLSFVADAKDAIIDKEATVELLEKYIPLDKHRGEVFKFLPRDASLESVFALFNDAIQVRERIGMVFITQNGKDHEKPLGILTAWDLANFDLDLLV